LFVKDYLRSKKMANLSGPRKKLAAAFMLALMLSGLAYSIAAAQTDEIYDGSDKVSLQRALETRSAEILHSILGHDKFIVSINLELNRGRFETFKETWKNGNEGLSPRSKGSSYTLPAMVDEALPGIPQKQTYESKNVNNTGGDSGMTKTTNVSVNMPSNIFKKIAVTIFIDKSVPKEDVKTIQKMTPVILGLDTRRGDTFSISTVTLKNKGLLGALSRNDNTLLTNIIKYGFIFGLIAVLIVLFFNRAKTLLADLAPFFEKTPEEKYPEEKEEEAKKKEEKMKEELEAGKEKGTEKQYFPFITEKDVNKLKYYLRNKDARTIAAILLYIDPIISAKVFAKMPREIKEAVTISMTHPMQLSPDVLLKLEEDVKNGVAGTAGGVEEFMEMFNNLPGHETQQILTTLEKHTPEIARMVKKLKFTMDDVVALPDNELEILLSHCKPKDVAAMTMTLKGEAAEKLQRVLNEDMQEMVREWSDMSLALPKKKLKESLEAIMLKAKELCENGTIAASRNQEDTEEFEYTSPDSGEKMVLTPQPQKRETASPAPSAAAVMPQEKSAGAPLPQQPAAKKLPPMDRLADLEDEKLLSLLNEINPKVLSIALQQNGDKIRARIAKISDPYLSKLMMYDTIIGKQPDWKVDEAKRSIMEKFAKVAAA
jgi:flagellar motor switch protein FliG